LLDVDAALCQAGQCWTRTSAGRPLYFDAVHLAPAGMDSLAPWLVAAVGRALAPGPPTADNGAGASPAAGSPAGASPAAGSSAGGTATVDTRPVGRR
ncbi:MULTISPECIES: SGNH hydrolase domain-containing protein, partial [unclassified Frankia]|uniref:SGNH hydrolase domain-containing protein n=1 Tax=unclassified Frankia TaxID=2632575 RepID=UPI002AD3A575